MAIHDSIMFLSNERDSSLGKPHKRLRLFFRAICFVTFLSKKRIARNTLVLSELLRDPSYVIDIDDHHEKEEPFHGINKEALAKLVREKDLNGLLLQFGGVRQVVEILVSDQKEGIRMHENEVKQRKETFGSNIYEKPPVKSFLSFVVEGFNDTTIVILLVCAVLSLGFGIKQHGPKEGWYDGGSIIVAVILVLAVSSISNFKQSRQFMKLSDESKDIKMEVVRDGHRQEVSIFDIVVGDVVCLKIGDQIPADGLFLDGHSLQVDESSMTGESDHVQINETQNPFLVCGTKVMDGYGHMLVTSVGANNAWGQMMCTITDDNNEQTPLQNRLNKLTKYIGNVGLIVAFLVLVTLLIRYFTGHTENDSGEKEFVGSKTKADDIMNSLIRIIAAAVTIIVVAIPEGLPLAVTLTLAYSMRRMMLDHAMVRKLSACETMGSATTILLGLVGLKDPCRPGVKEAVESCRAAGVSIKMITGDNVFTAKSIAFECGILQPGEDLNTFDKLLMVECLKQKGHVVAVTGDGTNDAPALKAADIGLSMGIQGTEVAKESSDIVIVNVAALVINFVAAASSGDVPLTAVQLLWVNLIMDTLGALALATERPSSDLMNKKPVGRTEPLITGVMWRNLLAQALYQVIVLLILQFKGSDIFHVNKQVKDTLIFNTFVLCQIFNEFNARNLEKKNIFRGILKNRLFVGIVGITILLQVIMVEFLRRFADTERLNWTQWAACIGISSLSWPIGWIIKCIPWVTRGYNYI